MPDPGSIITDQFGRVHNYLRISLTERCNLRCFYCMPPEGVALSPADSLMKAEEVVALAKIFVSLGVTKIRLTGGEPLVRKDFAAIASELAQLPVQLALTTNGVLVDKYIDLFRNIGLKKINVSLDSLREERFSTITRRAYFKRVMSNIHLLVENDIVPKINVVLIRGTNDDEILDFAELTRDLPLEVQFIEFMPFIGNKWHLDKGVYYQETLETLQKHYGVEKVEALRAEPHDTSKNFRIRNYIGSIGLINTVSNPFCDTCNRIRLTANGRIKNCLFSQAESDLLAAMRNGGDVRSLILESVYRKKKVRGGISDFKSNEARALVENNRSMVLIGG